VSLLTSQPSLYPSKSCFSICCNQRKKGNPGGSQPKRDVRKTDLVRGVETTAIENSTEWSDQAEKPDPYPQKGWIEWKSICEWEKQTSQNLTKPHKTSQNKTKGVGVGSVRREIAADLMNRFPQNRWPEPSEKTESANARSGFRASACFDQS
jgi:hypothetical protein